MTQEKKEWLKWFVAGYLFGGFFMLLCYEINIIPKL